MTIFRFRIPSMIVGIAIAAVPFVSHAGVGVRADRILSARDLEKYCQGSETNDVGQVDLAYCLGALTGIADTGTTLYAWLRSKQSICFEKSDNVESFRLSFLAHLQRNPNDRDMPASTVVLGVLAKQYPCAKDEK